MILKYKVKVKIPTRTSLDILFINFDKYYFSEQVRYSLLQQSLSFIKPVRILHTNSQGLPLRLLMSE